ncbi:Probable enoyl-CoA hydratase echA8 [Nocardia otitidiscaviarum]|uniref:Probable enoyl-CoA hydratase echA8 n=1 Tax=Nocardia otitidiscaviarum TaxID=1823 RepID=A0A379JIZ4_9NOCA|nr:enoyl-CoA hydratase/isomerase family protein [Nocardia otitidiscaviarum]MBF6236422.1 enoyl-CoA hydratase/isomerase family protein [Nocardia otitidiscaviarum]SUD47943.1 Probable enoyl-CoA hydratase echA8 [Nocardia otitidiscaviarum]
MYETLDVTIEERVAWLTLNRPQKLNALTPTSMAELREVFTTVDDDEDVCVVVLRGAGERAFCAGMDLGWSEGLTPKERVEQGRLGEKTFAMMERLSIPVVAAVHGYAVGGGLELALAADFIVCSDDAKLGLVEITLSARPPYQPKYMNGGADPDQPAFGGSAPGWGGVKRLPERIGKARAKELLFTGIQLDAQRALQLGLVNNVFPAAEFDKHVGELAERIAAMNRYNLRLVKELVSGGYDWIEPHPS